MALCSECRTVIPCHCHLTPPAQVRPGVYPAEDRWPAHPDQREETPAQTAADRNQSDQDDHRDEE